MGTHRATVDVRLAHKSDWELMCTALARAFHDDPVICHLIGPRNRERRMARFFDVDATSYRRRGRVYTTVDLAGAALWAEPGHWRTPILELAASAPKLLASFAGSIPKALRLLSRVEAAHPTDPHWYLAVLGTDPAHQGRGVGAALMGPVLAECDADGVGAYLESSKEANIPYYRRFGFEVTEEIAIPDGPTLWGMWRHPQPPS